MTIITVGILLGPILGVFFTGYFLPRCNLKSVCTGMILSFVLILWIAFGGWYYKTPVETLPFSVDECDFSKFYVYQHQSFFKLLYQISYTLYAPISTLLCILFAVLISFLTVYCHVLWKECSRFILIF
ncbi:Sodium-coupled monocarboxylate transporter 2, partial [Armadillidium nasatum]